MESFLTTLYKSQVAAASASFLASSFISIAIIRSDGGLTSPYRRIIFGFSVSDVLQSLSLLTGPFLVPSGIWAHGNNATCHLNAFLYLTGASSVPLYMAALCLYSALKISLRMTDGKFYNKIEKKIHVFVLLFVVGLHVTGIATDTIHGTSLGNVCLISAYPIGCRQNPDLECDPAIEKISGILNYIHVLGLEMFCLMVITVCMAVICAHVIKQGQITRGLNRTVRSVDDSVPLSGATESSDSAAHSDQKVKAYTKEIMIQAGLFVIAYLATFFCRWFVYLKLLLGSLPTLRFLIASSLLYPMGGFFNLFVYTRPKATILRKNNPGYSWIKAYWLIIKAGNRLPKSPVKNNGAIDRRCENEKPVTSLPHAYDISREDKSMKSVIANETDSLEMGAEKERWNGAISDENPVQALREISWGDAEPSKTSNSTSKRKSERRSVSFASSLTTDAGHTENILEEAFSALGHVKPKTNPSFSIGRPVESIPSIPARSRSPAAPRPKKTWDNASMAAPAMPMRRESEADTDANRTEAGYTSRGRPTEASMAAPAMPMRRESEADTDAKRTEACHTSRGQQKGASMAAPAMPMRRESEADTDANNRTEACQTSRGRPTEASMAAPAMPMRVTSDADADEDTYHV